MKQCDTCKRNDVMEQFAWLIEGDECYWDGRFPDSRGFTRKPNEAIRFLRREDAEIVKHHLLQFAAFALRTTEHCWVNSEHRA